MTTWTLVLLIYAGMFADTDSVTMHSVPGFTAEAHCNAQGNLGKKLVSSTKKDYSFICLKVN